MAAKPIPDGYHTVTAYLHIKGAAKALEFYKKAFNAVELFRMDGPDGRIGHAEIKIGDSPVMLADQPPERGARGTQSLGGASSSFLMYVAGVAARFQQGATTRSTGSQAVRDPLDGAPS